MFLGTELLWGWIDLQPFLSNRMPVNRPLLRTRPGMVERVSISILLKELRLQYPPAGLVRSERQTPTMGTDLGVSSIGVKAEECRIHARGAVLAELVPFQLTPSSEVESNDLTAL
jgi:hypothetical protein